MMRQEPCGLSHQGQRIHPFPPQQAADMTALETFATIASKQPFLDHGAVAVGTAVLATAPPQIPAGADNAPGSHLGW